MADVRDPRDSITPDAFTVAPELLGLPLARPSRRLAAILIDLIIVSIAIKAVSFTLFVLIAALLLFRVAKPSARGGKLRRGAAWAVRAWAVLLIALFGTIMYGKVRDFIREPRINIGASDDAADGENIALSLSDASVLRHVTAIADDRGDVATARVGAEGIAEWVRQRSADPAQREREARWVIEQLRDEPHGEVVEQALQPLLGNVPPPAPPDFAPVHAYLAALENGDSTQAAQLLAPAQAALAGERIGRLEKSRNQLESSNDSLKQALQQERESRGMRRFIAGLGDDLGVGFGWMAVYFTAFVVLWNGQTPGKRLLGIRIIRLDGKSLSWWLAFERFGGYAASFSTGLLGFAQILWDRNRQGMHDKFIETVVIRETAARAAVAPPPGRSAPPPRP